MKDWEISLLELMVRNSNGEKALEEMYPYLFGVVNEEENENATDNSNEHPATEPEP